jgi:hypothetical protein
MVERSVTATSRFPPRDEMMGFAKSFKLTGILGFVVACDKRKGICRTSFLPT